MCGVVGVWHTNGEPVDEAVLARMRDRLVTRGPDDAGIWTNQSIGLAHRRLSILDLSDRGRQPMEDEETGSLIVHNGEVYNYPEIRHELESKGVTFRSETDTEVILKSYRQWGPACLDRFIGMFAFAIWDAPKRGLFIARDRVGIKPLYFHAADGFILFASRLKALVAHPKCPREIDSEALALYLDLGYVPAPWSILKNVKKLQPGHFLWIDSQAVQDECYWSIDDFQTDSSLEKASDEEMTDRLEALLKDSIERRLISDVPLGAFLSGGIDSSMVVALMAQTGGQRPKSFTIGFEEEWYNEAGYARKIAEHLGTEHYEETMRSADLLGLIDDLQEHYDEPFADSSALPTMMVSRFARRHVTVCLSGDGGDELFAGYPQYDIIDGIRKASFFPHFARKLIGGALSRIQNHRFAMLGHCLMKPDLISSFSYIKSITKDYNRGGLFGNDGPSAETLYRARAETLPQLDPVSQMARLDVCYYMTDDILQKVDVASMSASLEARVPILDHRIVEFSLSLPISFKRRRSGKWILKQVLNRYVPRELVSRPKAGFNVPLNEWFRGELRERLQDELSPQRIKDFGFLDSEAVRNLIDLHFSGRRNTHPILWALVCLLLWSDQLKRF